jgi:hypothetical protein
MEICEIQQVLFDQTTEQFDLLVVWESDSKPAKSNLIRWYHLDYDDDLITRVLTKTQTSLQSLLDKREKKREGLVAEIIRELPNGFYLINTKSNQQQIINYKDVARYEWKNTFIRKKYITLCKLMAEREKHSQALEKQKIKWFTILDRDASSDSEGDDNPKCNFCKQTVDQVLKCSRCLRAHYCSYEHYIQDNVRHQENCNYRELKIKL